LPVRAVAKKQYTGPACNALPEIEKAAVIFPFILNARRRIDPDSPPGIAVYVDDIIAGQAGSAGHTVAA